MTIQFKDLFEDVYAADRGEKQWVDPKTGKTKKRVIQAHRIQFAASKLHKGAGEDDARPDYLKVKEEMEHLTQELHEVLSKDAKAGDWIHDFVHSDNPKFAGKSKKERIQMALGAYYAKQRNEETDTVVKDSEGKVVSWKHEGDWKKSDPKKNPEGKVHNLTGQALKKTAELNKEETGAYEKAEENKKSADSAKKQGDMFAHHLHMADHHDNLAQWNSEKGRNNVADLHMKKAEEHQAKASKLKEEVQLQERNKQNAIARKAMDAARGARYKLNNPVPDAEPEHKTAQAHNKAIGRALRNEAYQSYSGPSHGHAYGGTGFGRRPREDDEYHNEPSQSSSGNTPHAVHINGKKWKTFGSQSHATNVARKIKGATVHKEETAPVAPVPDRKYIKGTPEWKAHKEAQKPRTGAPTCDCKEETEMTEMQKYLAALGVPNLDFNSKVVVEKDMGTHGDDKAEEEEDVKLIKKMVKKDALKEESIDEAQYAGLEKEDKPGKVKTAVVKTHEKAVGSDTVEGWKDAKKPVKEGNEMSKSYKDFIAEMEFVNGRYVHKGTYGYGGKGAAYGQTDYDKEKLDAKDEAEPAPGAKRGPKVGSKRGPRKILGTSKLHTNK